MPLHFLQSKGAAKSDEIQISGRRIGPKIVFDYWIDRCVYLKVRATFVRPIGRTALYSKMVFVSTGAERTLGT